MYLCKGIAILHYTDAKSSIQKQHKKKLTTTIDMQSVIHLNMLQSAGIGAATLIVGIGLTHKIKFLQKFCIPSPVSGGLLFSIIALLFYSMLNMDFEFDDTLQNVFMLAFYTSVGFQTDLKALRKGGKPLVYLLVVLAVLMSLQNLLPIGIAKMCGTNPLVGMAAGSISMAGGHGTAGGFSPLLEEMGFESALTASMACATFGLIAGSVIGGPISAQLIRKRLKGATSPTPLANTDGDADLQQPSPRPIKGEQDKGDELKKYAHASYTIIIVMALGVVTSHLLQATGITAPTYFGALITAACLRIVCDATPCRKYLEIEKIVNLGYISLSVFLAMAMVSLKLWQLEDLAIPLVVMLFSQVVMMALFIWFVAFPMLGKNYDSAVLCSGICGFGLGATPNAMANMSAICDKFGYTVKPFLIVPIVGAMFVDMMNTGIISLFLSWLK